MAGDDSETSKLGYVSHIENGDRHWGGILVVDMDGDPLDFAFTDAVEISPLSRPLFGDRLQAYLLGKVLARPLLNALELRPDVLCFDEPALLARRLSLEIPLAVFAPADARVGRHWVRSQIPPEPDNGYGWYGETGQEQLITRLLDAAGARFGPLSLAEPFDRVRLALKGHVGER